MNEVYEKLDKLKQLLEEYSQVVIAFSGGVDSTFLAKVAYDALADKAVAITIASPQLPKHELDEAKDLANEIGIKHYIIDGSKADVSWFENNRNKPKPTINIISRVTKTRHIVFCFGYSRVKVTVV